MKRKMKLKYLLLGLLAFTAVSTAQVKQRFPSAVRYIAGYYVASRPYFPTLETALNDVKAYATAEDPYVFWLMGDTLRIADWDSVFTESGLTMKDSIDQYYVSAGKIKWAGFGQGGGTGSSTIARASQTTTHYSYPNWNQFSAAFPYWQRDLAKALDSIDQHIYDLIVYTAEPLYIENDTLKIDTTGWNIGAAGSSGWDPDTNRVVVTDRAQTIASVKTFISGLLMGTGSYLQIPPAVGSAGTARLIWTYNNRLYFNTTGTDSSRIIDIDVNADTTRDVEFIGYYDLDQTLKDSLAYKQDKITVHSFLSDAAYTPNVTGGGVYTKFTPTWDESEIDNMTLAGDTITVNTGFEGDFFISVCFTSQNAGTDDFTFQVRKNNVLAHSFRWTGAGASEYVTVSSFHYFEGLVAGDDISFYITNTVDADDPVLTEINLYLTREHE